MATNYVQDGARVTVTAPTGGYTSGQFVPLPAAGTGQKFIGVAATAGTSVAVELITEGVFSVTTKKAGAGEAWVVGDDVYLTSTGDFTETATSNGYAGVVWEAAATGATTGKIRINFGGDPR